MKTNKLTGTALDWAVAKCEGEIRESTEAAKVGPLHVLYRPERDTSMGYVRMKDKLYILESPLAKAGRSRSGAGLIPNYGCGGIWEPSTDWALGGPIIERERIVTSPCSIISPGTPWVAHSAVGNVTTQGETPLIAAMRCYVASKLGDELELPQELSIVEKLEGIEKLPTNSLGTDHPPTLDKESTELTYIDHDGATQKLLGCELTVDKLDRYWIWSDQLGQNLAYRTRGRENALLAAIDSLLFTIELRDSRIAGLKSASDLAENFVKILNSIDE